MALNPVTNPRQGPTVRRRDVPNNSSPFISQETNPFLAFFIDSKLWPSSIGGHQFLLMVCGCSSGAERPAPFRCGEVGGSIPSTRFPPAVSLRRLPFYYCGDLNHAYHAKSLQRKLQPHLAEATSRSMKRHHPRLCVSRQGSSYRLPWPFHLSDFDKLNVTSGRGFARLQP